MLTTVLWFFFLSLMLEKISLNNPSFLNISGFVKFELLYSYSHIKGKITTGMSKFTIKYIWICSHMCDENRVELSSSMFETVILGSKQPYMIINHIKWVWVIPQNLALKRCHAIESQNWNEHSTSFNWPFQELLNTLYVMVSCGLRKDHSLASFLYVFDITWVK